MGAEHLLEIRDLVVSMRTHRGPVEVVDGVSLTVDSGETLCVVGESGAGKSTLAAAVTRSLPVPAGRVERGDILFRGRSILAMSEREVRALRGDKIASVFQDPLASLDPLSRVGTQVAESLIVHRGMSRKAARANAVDLLRSVGIPDPERRAREHPHEFSGGMRQRAMIAAALANDPELIIADEPTSSLDVTVQAQILELLVNASRDRGAGLLLITHDLGIVASVADRVLVMYAGRPVEAGSVETLFYQPHHPYTRLLVDAASGRTVQTPPPQVGCPFRDGCDRAGDVCAAESPRFVPKGPMHFSACHFAGDAAQGCVEPGFEGASR